MLRGYDGPPSGGLTMAKSTQRGMGALPFGGGVGFCLWAPFATSVRVAGTFNSWSTQAHPLEAEGDGYWSRDVSQARVGDEYNALRWLEQRGCDGLRWDATGWIRNVRGSNTDHRAAAGLVQGRTLRWNSRALP